MSDYEKEVDRVWIGVNPGAYNRERAIKEHLEHQEESRKRQEDEAERTRRAAEEGADEARRQSRILEDQRRNAEEMAEESRRHSAWMEDKEYRKRQAPETLFSLTEQRDHVMEACNRILSDSNKKISFFGTSRSITEPAISGIIDEVEPFFSTLSRLDSSYLDKQSDKRLLRDLRAEFQPVEKRIYAALASRRVDWLLNEAIFMAVACRTLTTPDARKTDQELRQVRDNLESFCNKLFSSWYIRGVDPLDEAKVEPLRSDFKGLVTAVNNAQWWQIRCAEEDAVAKAAATFAPLQTFSQTQIQEYFCGIEQLNKLKGRKESSEECKPWLWCLAVLIVLVGLGLLMTDVYSLGLLMSDVESKNAIGAAVIGAGSLFFVVVSELAKSAKVRYQSLQKALINMYPLRQADHLRWLWSQVEWERNGWVVPEKTLLQMMDLKKLQIPVPD